MRFISKKSLFYFICTCQIAVIVFIVLSYYRNVEWNDQMFRFRCKEEQPFRYENNRYIRLSLDIEKVPREYYKGEIKLVKGMVVYCTLRDIHGYHQVENISTTRPGSEQAYIKTRIQNVYDETYRLEINFNRSPL